MRRLQEDIFLKKVIQLSCIVIIIAGLYFSKGVLAPFLVAALFAFALSPIVKRIEIRFNSKTLAITIVTVGAIVICFSTVWVVVTQIQSLEADIGRYSRNILQRIDFLTKEFYSLRQSFFRTAPPPKVSNPFNEDVLVSALSLIGGRVLDNFAFFGLVIVYTTIMIASLDDIRDRWIQCVGERDIPRVAKLTDEASLRISRYLSSSLATNAMYGLLFTGGLFVLGIPQYLLWGALSVILRFIPFIGGVISVLPPLILSLGLESANSWIVPGYLLGIVFILELVFSQFVEPKMIGKYAGLSSLALVLLTVFWTAIWGLTGMMLATPLSVCFVTLGRHIPGLRILTVLFGEDELLDSPTRLYHRLMTNDSKGVADIISHSSPETSGQTVSYICDALLIPCTQLAQNDYIQGRLTRREFLTFWSRARHIVPRLLSEFTEANDQKLILFGQRIALVGTSKEDGGIARITQWALEAEGADVVLKRIVRSRRTTLRVGSRRLVSVSRYSPLKNKNLVNRFSTEYQAKIISFVWGKEERAKSVSSVGEVPNLVTSISQLSGVLGKDLVLSK